MVRPEVTRYRQAACSFQNPTMRKKLIGAVCHFQKSDRVAGSPSQAEQDIASDPRIGIAPHCSSSLSQPRIGHPSCDHAIKHLSDQSKRIDLTASDGADQLLLVAAVADRLSCGVDTVRQS